MQVGDGGYMTHARTHKYLVKLFVLVAAYHRILELTINVNLLTMHTACRFSLISRLLIAFIWGNGIGAVTLKETL